jgi:sugar lactone lactonase YvrE
MMEEIRCVVPAGDICGEGAAWCSEQNALYWTDINRSLVHRYDASTQATETWIFDEPVTAVALTTVPEVLVLVLASKVGFWSPETHPQVQPIYTLASAPEMRFNDARVDPRGSLWAGTMRNNVGPEGENLDVTFSGGVLYRIDPGGAVSEWKKDIGISNTVAWSPNRTRFYFGDSIANVINSYSYNDKTGVIAGELPLLTGYSDGLPDGSAIDAEGYLWNARYGGRCLIRIAPDGRVDRKVAMPVLNPTTCTFGGADLRTLYITSARSAEKLSGSIFSMDLDVGGIPDYRFRLQ